MLVVRPYRAAELPAIVQCGVQTSVESLVQRNMPGATAQGVASQLYRMYENTLMVPDATILVAEWPPEMRGQGPAAYALLLPQPNPFTGEREVVVMDIFTHPALRGRKVGQQMLEHAIRYSRSIGAGGITAQVALHNQSSRGMFRGAGFQEERVVVGRRV